MLKISTNQICAVVVSYNPEESIISNVEALLLQLKKVIVVDNNSGEPSLQYLKEIEKKPGVHVIYNDKNLGIATALNIGAQIVIREGYLWLATFDDDSLVTTGYFESLLRACESYKDRDKVAIISPIYHDKRSGVQYIIANQKTSDGLKPYKIDVTMTSGNLVKTSHIKNIGFYDESLFIDYVDYDFCLRASKLGYQIIQTGTAVLLHSLGQLKRHTLFGKSFHTMQYNKMRRYYQTRNRLILIRRHWTHKPSLLLREATLFIKDIIRIAFFEDDSREKMVYFSRGFIDGLKGRKGKRYS
ncbi:MAG: glycosyltransferase family 2 protein [Deltaproteobacteria bacterium]|nr:glycosyltransferase family 2 protein [Deltaproteobacteria bacterium]